MLKIHDARKPYGEVMGLNRLTLNEEGHLHRRQLYPTFSLCLYLEAVQWSFCLTTLIKEALQHPLILKNECALKCSDHNAFPINIQLNLAVTNLSITNSSIL